VKIGLSDAEGTLTKNLPLVCRRFRHYCNRSESLWLSSLERLISSKPDSWGEGVRSILLSVRSIPLDVSIVEQVYSGDSSFKVDLLQSMKQEDLRKLLQTVCKIATQQAFRNGAKNSYVRAGMGEGADSVNQQQRCCEVKLAYRCLITEHMMVKMPVFYMPSPLQLNQPIGLHFFEPRYRRLIAEVTVGRTSDELSGGQMKEPLPRFVFACNSPLAAGTNAFVVELHRCRLYINGRADVLVNPVRQVRLVKVEEQRGSDSLGLCDVTIKRV